MVTLDIEDTCIRMLVVKGGRLQKAATVSLKPGWWRTVLSSIKLL